MTIPVCCPNCQFVFEMSPESAGKALKCPKCANAFIAPPFAAPKDAAPLEATKSLTASTRRKPFIIAAVAIILAVAVIGGYLLLNLTPRTQSLREIPFSKRAAYVRALAYDIGDPQTRNNLLALLARFENNPSTRSLATPRAPDSDPILAAMENAETFLEIDREAAIRSLDTALDALKQMEPRQRPAGNVTRARAGYAGPLAVLYVRAGADARAVEAQSLTNQPREITAPFDSLLSQGLREKDFALALAATRGIKRDDSFPRHLLNIGVQALQAGETKVAEEALAAARAAQAPIPNGETHLEAELPMLYRLCIAGRGDFVCQWMQKREIPRGDVADVYPLWTILRISGDHAGAARLLAQCASILAVAAEKPEPDVRRSIPISRLFHSLRLIAEAQMDLAQPDAAAATLQSLEAAIKRNDVATSGSPFMLQVLERRASLASAYARLGNNVQANALLASVIEETEKLSDGSVTSAYVFIAEAQARMGDLPGAVATLKKTSVPTARSLRQPMPNPLGSAYFELALAYWKAGNVGAATDAYTQALDLQFPIVQVAVEPPASETGIPGFGPPRGRQGGAATRGADGSGRQPPISIPLLPNFHLVGYQLSFTPEKESLFKAADRIRDSYNADRWTMFANLTLGVAARGDLPTALGLWQRYPLMPRGAARTGLLEVAARRGNLDLVLQHIDTQDPEFIQPLVQNRVAAGDFSGAARIFEAALAAEPGRDTRRSLQLIMECATTVSPETALRAAESFPSLEPAITAQLQLLAGKLEPARTTAKSLPEGRSRDLALQRLAHQALQPTRVLLPTQP